MPIVKPSMLLARCLEAVLDKSTNDPLLESFPALVWLASAEVVFVDDGDTVVGTFVVELPVPKALVGIPVVTV